MFVLFFLLFCFGVDLLYMPDNQKQSSYKIEETQRMATDAILTTQWQPVSVQNIFPVNNVTKANIASSSKHPFHPHILSVSSISTAASRSVTSHFASLPQAPQNGTNKTMELICQIPTLVQRCMLVWPIWSTETFCHSLLQRIRIWLKSFPLKWYSQKTTSPPILIPLVSHWLIQYMI